MASLGRSTTRNVVAVVLLYLAIGAGCAVNDGAGHLLYGLYGPPGHEDDRRWLAGHLAIITVAWPVWLVGGSRFEPAHPDSYRGKHGKRS